jgi:hypothetical protein
MDKLQRVGYFRGVRAIVISLRSAVYTLPSSFEFNGTRQSMNEEPQDPFDFLDLVLRNKPETIGLEPDADGWVGIGDLLKKAKAHGVSITLDELDAILDDDDDEHFSYSEDGLKIRANFLPDELED